ncbi:MAG: twin-arginine translocation pathway signal protein [Hyphomicrobiales bacterium]|nr:MAG: twin-arginine translocation pathway signal protein [Hyphomicrobiales bacterium]
MNRRELLGAASMGAVVLAAGIGQSSAKMVPPWVWTDQHGLTNKMRKDKNPLDKEFEKYPRCPYCGMARKMWSHTRHLIQYDDDSTEGTCSIHCASLSLALNMDRNPKNIWVGDAGAEAKVKPLINADKAYYAINPAKPGTMTAVSKWAYADEGKAKAGGGELVNFDGALQAAYEDMAKSTLRIRKMRAEKRAHMMKKMKMMKKDK